MVFQDYAQYYDVIYQKKSYQRECNFILNLASLYGAKNVKTILDLGCGTGNHLLPFLKKGYDASGVDCSREMLSLAREKIKLNQFIKFTKRIKILLFLLSQASNEFYACYHLK